MGHPICKRLVDHCRVTKRVAPETCAVEGVGMESKGLCVKMSRTKIVVLCLGIAVLRKVGMKPRASM